VRAGSVNASNYYIYKNNKWQAATPLEYDTYGKSCSTDGSIVSGNVTFSNKYVCDAGIFRATRGREISLNKGCVNYTEGDEIRIHLAATHDSVYLCSDGWWRATLDFYGTKGTFTDSRNGKKYKTVTIGTQTWMAENLNYGTENSYCYGDSSSNCTQYGRLYTWSAAISACPSGWHLPTRNEYETLVTVVGGESVASGRLMSTTGWGNFSMCNGSDVFGFTALPAGARSSSGDFDGLRKAAHFWSSTEVGDGAYIMTGMKDTGGEVYLNTGTNKSRGLSVRCIKN
jgi:uncharacterized protein (TIGR02145 family)